jgi:hypothetical protein
VGGVWDSAWLPSVVQPTAGSRWEFAGGLGRRRGKNGFMARRYFFQSHRLLYSRLGCKILEERERIYCLNYRILAEWKLRTQRAV